MRFPSRWEISVSSSCCSSSSTLRWEWSSSANWVSHTTTTSKHTHAAQSTSFSKKKNVFFKSTHYNHSHDAESSLSSPICLPGSLSLSLRHSHIRGLLLTRKRSHLHDHIYLRVASSIGRLLPNSFSLRERERERRHLGGLNENNFVMKMFAFCGTLLGFRSTCWEVEWMSVYQFYK